MAFLVLEDGTIFSGKPFGSWKDGIGEVVFNTGMTGYQEILTDPSYCGQIVVMTYPLIGNYGVNSMDVESQRPQVKGFIVRELCEDPSNWNSEMSLDEYLSKNNIMGIQGIDTRSLTKRIREKGTMRGMMTKHLPTPDMMEELKSHVLHNPVPLVTTEDKYTIAGDGYKIAVMDFGLKRNILRSLSRYGCSITVYPALTPYSEILKDEPDGIMLTNGPGDPKDNVEVIENIKILMREKPIFGICLGHQLLALAAGADTEKLKYGHRGCNHPVKDLERERIYITSQNHGYTIVKESIPSNMEVSHLNLNDGTIEGIRYKDRPVFSVQFHPEASPGPTDTAYLFNDFMEMIKSFAKR